MKDLSQYYEVLGLKPDAAAEDIKRAWRDLAMVWHPDRFPADSRVRSKAEQKLREINEAYHVLCTTVPGGSPAPQQTPCDTPPPPRGARPPYYPRTVRVGAPAGAFLWRTACISAVAIGLFAVASTVYRTVQESAVGVTSKLARGHSGPVPDLPRVPGADELMSRAGDAAKRALFPVTSVPVDMPIATTRSDGRQETAPADKLPRRPRPTPPSRIPPGTGVLRITNQTELEAVGTITGEQSPTNPLAVVHIGARNQAIVERVGPGSYFVRFQIGSSWDSSRQRFRGPTRSAGPIGPFRYVQIQDSSGFRSDAFEIVLNPRSPER